MDVEIHFLNEWEATQIILWIIKGIIVDIAPVPHFINSSCVNYFLSSLTFCYSLISSSEVKGKVKNCIQPKLAIYTVKHWPFPLLSLIALPIYTIFLITDFKIESCYLYLTHLKLAIQIIPCILFNHYMCRSFWLFLFFKPWYSTPHLHPHPLEITSDSFVKSAD